MATKLLNLVALSSLAIMACTFGAPPTNALSTGHLHANRYVEHAPIAARKKRDQSKRCKPRPSSSLASSSATHTTTSAHSQVAAITTTHTQAAPSSTKPAAPVTTSKASSGNSGSSGSGSANLGQFGTPGHKICNAWGNGNDPSLANFKTEHVIGLYDWGVQKPANADKLGYLYMPMLWGGSKDKIDEFEAAIKPGLGQIILGFNEPNEEGQSNMSPQTAAALWKQHIQPKRSMGYKLATPAMSSRPNGFAWMQDFFKACGDECTFDFQALHYYDIGFEKLQAYLEKYHNEFNLPILLTEFADQNFNGGGQATMDEIWQFMGQALAFFDQTEWIAAACPFGVMHDLQGVNPLNLLQNPDGSPTALGSFVINDGNFGMTVKHLPPAVKQLLTLRTPQPRPTPSLSKLTGVLSSTYEDAKAKKAERGWLTLATCTLLTANAPPTIGHLYRFATRTDLENAATRRSLAEALDKAALMRESALKSCIFVGVPRTILSLANLNETIEDDVRNGLRMTSVRTVTRENVDEIVARGEALWASIYEPHAEKLRNKLGSYHPDFIGRVCLLYAHAWVGALRARVSGPPAEAPSPVDAPIMHRGIMQRVRSLGPACPRRSSSVWGIIDVRRTCRIVGMLRAACPLLNPICTALRPITHANLLVDRPSAPSSRPFASSVPFIIPEFIIQAYGTVLAPLPGGDAVQGNLSRALGSVVGTACLRAEGGVGPQLTSHVFGLLKARNVPGLSEEDYWLASDEGTEWVVRTVDKLLDVVKPELGDGPGQAKL
ncbi:Glycoside Hydrolase Family 128 protein [Trametes cinnabarina]|uniref:Glycoside Hydrolase Family 128 protein n=1 Tax=Pycnoporus cinnabarinus TaxID=5643 RepID=A0A060SP94_PYCCI|nr:Glycoside Hydrolase Family 128 protein [Trametes cinnabarina]